MNFDEKISQGFALVDYWAPWCQPCLDQNPLLDQIALELESKVQVFKVDVNDNRVIANREGAMNIPLLILYKHGEPLARYQGIQSKQILIHAIQKIIDKK